MPGGDERRVRSRPSRRYANPQYLYHLALASAAAGDRPGDRSALKKALDRNQQFDGASDAARLLYTLQE